MPFEQIRDQAILPRGNIETSYIVQATLGGNPDAVRYEGGLNSTSEDTTGHQQRIELR